MGGARASAAALQPEKCDLGCRHGERGCEDREMIEIHDDTWGSAMRISERLPRSESFWVLVDTGKHRSPL